MTIATIIKSLNELMEDPNTGVDKAMASRALLQSGITDVVFSNGSHRFTRSIKTGDQVKKELIKNLSEVLGKSHRTYFLVKWP